MAPSVAGMGAATVGPGASFDLDITLTSPVGDTHDSAIFRVVFSAPGLRYDGYSWASPYLNETLDDDSTPLSPDLPVVLGAATLAGIGYPAGVVDVELSNVLPAGPDFGVGRIVTLSLHVPVGYSGPDVVTITIVPDTLASGFAVVPTHAGTPFVLTIPAAPSVGLLACGAGLVARRRRRP